MLLHRQVNYWIQFVESHAILGSSSPHVVVIGSHADLISKGQMIEKYVMAQLKSSLLIDGFFAIDCRQVHYTHYQYQTDYVYF